MASEVGVGYVRLIPSMQGFGPATAKGLNDTVPGIAGKAGERAGGRFANSFAGKAAAGISRGVDRIGQTIVSGIQSAGVVAGGLLGAAVFTGWDRLTTIQDSTQALTILLGDASKAADVLDGVLDVVRGTPFRLDQFAAGASQLVGFGVEANKVPGILESIADAAAVQGKRAPEFADRLIDSFGQITARGRVQLQDVWSISQTGVNALAILANGFGVTADEMQEMISSGAVPAGEAIDILTKGIKDGSDGIAGSTRAFDGLAQSLGTTLSGGLANAGAALARFGATLVEPFGPALTTGFQAFIDLVDMLGEAIGSRLAGFVESSGFQSFIGWLEDLPNKIGPAVESVKGLGPALAPLGAAAAAIASSGIAGVLGPFGRLLPVINPLAAAVAALVLATPGLRDSFGQLVVAAEPLILAFGQTLFAAVTGLATAAIPLLSAALDIAIPLITWMGEQSAWVAPLILGFAAAVKILNIAMRANPIGLVITALVLLGLALKAAWDNSETFRTIVTTAFNVVKAIVIAWWNRVKTVFNAVVAVVKFVAGQVRDRFNTFRTIFNNVRNWVANAVTWIRGRFNALVTFVRGLPGRIRSAASGMWNGIKDAFRGAINFIIDGWNNLSLTLPGIDTVFGRIGGWTLNTPNIPRLAAGGIVDSATLAMIGEAGPEAVMPLDRLESMFSSANTQPAMATAIIQLNANGDRHLTAWLREMVRSQGGDVQVVLGA